ncbi:unnamed protein product [Trifolium pratense]|uniref:Uncharacterized protein n=1 Tax=Trifolium pratense TaxID=57577 RepID=A0ACB0IJQ3_TRIPR|nr:unnamed protein product [Trifolium pratense]
MLTTVSQKICSQSWRGLTKISKNCSASWCEAFGNAGIIKCGTSVTRSKLCERAIHLITSWRNAQRVRALVDMPQQIPHQTRWMKSIIERYKFDASFSYLHNKVGIGMCIRDDQERFGRAKTEWLEPILDVEIGEAMGLLSALKWIEELHFYDTGVEVDCKRVVGGLYSKRNFNSDFGVILSDCKVLLATNLVNSNVKFIRRQANEVAHSFARMVTSLASFHNFLDIPTCIYDIIMNEMR